MSDDSELQCSYSSASTNWPIGFGGRLKIDHEVDEMFKRIPEKRRRRAKRYDVGWNEVLGGQWPWLIWTNPSVAIFVEHLLNLGGDRVSLGRRQAVADIDRFPSLRSSDYPCPNYLWRNDVPVPDIDP